MSTTSQIQEIYVGLLGRAADSEGLAYWTAEINGGVLTIEQLRANIVNEQPEYAANLGSLSRSDLVTTLYENLFERAPEADGLAYWTTGGGSTVNADQLVLALSNGASTTDRAALDNKTTAATYYTNSGVDYVAANATAAVSAVDNTTSTLVASKNVVDSLVAGSASTLTLTTATGEVVTGTAGSNTISAYHKATDDSKNTLHADDTVTDPSKTDMDTMIITVEDVIAATDTGPVTNVEIIDFRVDSTLTNSTTTVSFDMADFSNVQTIKTSVVKDTSAVNAVTLTNLGDGVQLNAGESFKTVTVDPSSAGNDATVYVLNAGSAGTAAAFDNATTAFGDLTIQAAGYLDVDTDATGVLNVEARQITALTGAAATVMDLTAYNGNIVVDDASAVVVANVVASGDVDFAESAANGSVTITAGGTVDFTGASGAVTGNSGTTAVISATGNSTIVSDALTTLTLSGNGGKLTMDMGAAHEALAAVTFTGSEDVVLKIDAAELDSGGTDSDSSIFYTDAGTGTGTFTLEVDDADFIDLSSGDVIDRLEIKANISNVSTDATGTPASTPGLKVANTQNIVFTVDQTNTAGEDTIQVGSLTAAESNSVTITLDDETSDTAAVDLNGTVVEQAKTVTIDASVDTNNGARNVSLLTSFKSNDVANGELNIVGGVNGIKIATALTAAATGTITVTGSGKVELQDASITAALLDASAVTGVVSATGLDSNLKAIKTGSANDTLGMDAVGAISIESGAGNDTITLDDADYKDLAISIDGGAGTDILKLTATDGGATTGTLLKAGDTGSISLANIETLQLVAGSAGTLAIDGDLLHEQTYGVEFTTSGATQTVTVVAKTTDTAIDLGSLVGSASSDTSVAGATFVTDASSNTASIAITGIDGAKNQIEGSGASGDVLTGGSKVDTFVVDTDALLFNADNEMLDTYVGGAGDDILKLGATAAGFEVVVGDDFSGMSEIVKITSGANTGAISLTLGSSAETAGLTTIDLSGDSNSSGANAINVGAYTASATVTGSAGVDTITGGAGGDIIKGGAGADVLAGGAGDDTFVFDSIIDLFEAAASNNMVDTSIAGGDGTDTIEINVAPSVAAAETMDATDPFADITSVEILKTKGASADAISITPKADATAAGITTIDISSDTNASGSNTIDASNMTAAVTITGSAGVDTITGTASDDTIIGGAGNDVISGGSGADTIVFAASAALNGADDIDAFVQDTDVLNFDAFLGDGYDILGSTGITTSITFFTGSNNDDVDIAGKLAIFEVSADYTSDAAAAIGDGITAAQVFAEIDGASNAFALSDGKAIIIAIDEDTDAADAGTSTVTNVFNIFYVDTATDGAAGLSVNDVKLIAVDNTANTAASAIFKTDMFA